MGGCPPRDHASHATPRQHGREHAGAGADVERQGLGARRQRHLRQGLLVGKPVGHPLRPREGDTPGAADNKFSMIDVSDANMSFGTYAG